MTKSGAQLFLLIGTIILVIAIALTILFSPEPNKGLRDPGAALTIIALGSVAIERIIEGFWTYIGLTINTWWPLKAFSQDIENLATELTSILDPFYQALMNAIDQAKVTEGWTDDQYNAAKQDIDNFKQYINQLEHLPPGSQQSLAIATAATQLIQKFQEKYKIGDTLVTVANEAITSFAQSIANPTDDLGRRFISLYIGAFLGLITAAFFGLDVVQAIFLSSPPVLAFHVGTVLTGLVMGLGSSPTHEIIQLLQELKTNFSARNMMNS